MNTATLLSFILAVPSIPEPSSEWVAAEDPAPPSDASRTRFFRHASKPAELRTGVVELSANYSASFMLKLSERVRSTTPKLTIHEARSFELDEVPIGVLKTSSPESIGMQYYLPGHDGDLVVALIQPIGEGDRKLEEAVLHLVLLAKDLRRPDDAERMMDRTLWVLAGVASAVLLLGMSLVLLRRSRGRTPA